MSHDQSAQPVRPEMVNGIPDTVLNLLVEAKKTPSKYEDAGRALVPLLPSMPPPFVSPAQWSERLADLCSIGETVRRLGIHDWLAANTPQVFSRVPTRHIPRFVKGVGDAAGSGEIVPCPPGSGSLPPLDMEDYD